MTTQPEWICVTCGSTYEGMREGQCPKCKRLLMEQRDEIVVTTVKYLKTLVVLPRHKPEYKEWT